MNRCPQCGEWTFDGKTARGKPHRCPPKWLVWRGDDWDYREQYPQILEEGEVVYAHDAQEAVEQHCANNFAACDYNVDYDWVVMRALPELPEPDYSTAQRFSVETETVPIHHAREVKPEVGNE